MVANWSVWEERVGAHAGTLPGGPGFGHPRREQQEEKRGDQRARGEKGGENGEREERRRVREAGREGWRMGCEGPSGNGVFV